MKAINYLSKAQMFFYTFLATLFIGVLKAQEKTPDLKVDVNTTSDSPMGGGDWMSNPLVWVIGALVLILIIALVARGGGSKS